MPQPTTDDFWKLLAQSRLLGPAVLGTLRKEQQGMRDPAGSAAAVASWLVAKGSLTEWQARRLLAGERGPFFLGEYRLLERLEHPAGVPLFRARHDPSGRDVAVVLLSKSRCQDQAVLEGIVRRATAAIAAADPVLSRTWAVEQAEAARFIVCEHVPGESLAAALARGVKLDPRTAGGLAFRVARSVGTLHARGEAHGGLSLDSIRLPVSSGQPDPAAARVLQYPLVGDPHLNPPRLVLGGDEDLARLGERASFVAPELTRPDTLCTPQADVYAVGCILQALLTGQPPGWSGDPRATLRQAATVGLPPLGPPLVPQEVGTLVSYLTAREPESRYQNGDEAADAIAACFALEVGPAPAVAIVTDSLPAPVVASSPGRRPRNPGKSRPLPKGLVGSAIAVAVAMVAAAVWLDPFGWRDPPGPRSSSPEKQTAGSSGKQSGAGAEAEQHDAASPAATTASTPGRSASGDPGTPAAPPAGPGGRVAPLRLEVVADATLPWEAPTHGTPLGLTYLPGGCQLLLAIRPAEILADEEGRLFFRSLGPDVESAAAWLSGVCGCGLEQIESVHAGWQTAADGTVLGACVVRLAPGHVISTDDTARGRRWGTQEVRQVGGESIHEAGRHAFWTPKLELGRVLVVAAAELIDGVVQGGTAAPEVPADLEELLERLDGRRHLAVAAATLFLFTEGKGVFSGPLVRLADPLERFLGDEVRAVGLAAHFGPNFYAEFDAMGTLDAAAARLTPELRAKFDSLPDAAEDYVTNLSPHPHGKRLVNRLPGMLRALAENLRSGPEGRLAVLNAYLPRHAGHNLALAGELVLAQTPGQAPAVAAATAPGAAAAQDAPGALARLKKPMTLVFARDTLEKSVQMISEEIGVPIEINGPDLQLEGITKNQSFALAERDSTADAILRVILARSNADGKLVYVVRRQGATESIEVTTRAAAAKRGDALPPGFEPPTDDQGATPAR